MEASVGVPLRLLGKCLLLLLLYLVDGDHLLLDILQQAFVFNEELVQ